jgi:hypothetical protein
VPIREVLPWEMWDKTDSMGIDVDWQGVYHFSPLYSLPRQESGGYGYRAGKSDTPGGVSLPRPNFPHASYVSRPWGGTARWPL